MAVGRILVRVVLLAAAVVSLADRALGVEGSSADEGEAGTRRARVLVLPGGVAAPEDLIRPEGRTRWDLTRLGPQLTRQMTVVPGHGWAGVGFEPTASPVASAASDLPATRGSACLDTARRYVDPAGGDAAERWLFPDRYGHDLRMGTRTVLDLVEEPTCAPPRVEAGGQPGSEVEARPDAKPERLRIEVEIVGVGWVHLPSGPREVALQRALVMRERWGTKGLEPDRLVHRWIDPLAGVVAEASGVPAPDGRTRTSTSESWVLDTLLTPASPLKLHVDEVDTVVGGEIIYGIDRGKGTAVAALTPEGYSNIGQLVAASHWDFSANNTGTLMASYTVNVSDRDTCNAGDTNGDGTSAGPLACGYNLPGGLLDRRDRGPDTASPQKFNSVSQRETRAQDAVIWLRAGSQKEGLSGSFGMGESRFCYWAVDDGGDGTMQAYENRSPVPEWVFPHNDGDGLGFYMQSGDSWQMRGTCTGGTNPGAQCLRAGECQGGGTCTSVLNCEQNVYNQVCGASGIVTRLYSKACTGSDGVPHTGKHYVDVIKNGVITTASGHTFNAVLARNVADFCVYTAQSCANFTKVSEVRTVNYLWQVPRLGTLARIQSAQDAPDLVSWTTVEETDFVFGLFPPRTIQVTGTTSSSITLGWDPGLITSRISGYKIYWDTDPGALNAYAFNSQTHPAQVSISGTSATISGLAPGTVYYVTVTALSTYNRALVAPTGTATSTYESVVYPTQVYGLPDHVYPMEVAAATTAAGCVPTQPVANLTIAKTSGGYQFCWNPANDPCLTGYRLVGDFIPDQPGTFGHVADVGLTTCWTGWTQQRFYLVKGRGGTGVGP